MAAIVALYTGDLPVTPLVEDLNTQQQRPASVESTWLLEREIEALAELWTRFHHGSKNSRDMKFRRSAQHACSGRRFREIKDKQCETYTSQTLDLLPPPSYEESIADLPPDYTGTGALAVVHQSLVDVKLEAGPHGSKSRDSQRRSDDKVDFTQPRGIRFHANKKAKKAAKAAQNAKWADDDGEKKEEAPPPDEGAGGGGDAGDAGGAGDGAGGDPPGGGDGGGGEDPDDIWGAVGGKKNKKKKKKNAW